ncbi:MAG TPA: hypothetical protein PK765_06885 [bacterium]|nr:hypothetical protein [bacterium]
MARLPTAVVAGGLDGAFEVMQGGVDLATVPDKIAGNIASLVSALRTNAPAVWQAIEQSID